MRGLVSIIALGLATMPAQARSTPAPSSFAIPFELSEGHIFVEAYVDGTGPYRFGFDTGASGEGRVDARVTAALSLPKAGEGESSDGIRTAQADEVTVKTLRLGSIEKSNLQLLSRDYNRGRTGKRSIMGIIARDFFADWLVTIDYPKRTIGFRKGHLRRGDPGVVEYGPSFAIPVCFRSGCYTGKVDTGSSRSIVVPRQIASKLSTTTPVTIGEAKRMNSSVTLAQMTLKEPVQLSGLTINGQTVISADPSDEFINVGSDFLKDYVLMIDQSRHLLTIRQD